jgi:hypothetical protein
MEYEISILNHYLKAFEAAIEYYNNTSHHKVEILSNEAKADFTEFKLFLEDSFTTKNFLFQIGRLHEKFISSFSLSKPKEELMNTIVSNFKHTGIEFTEENIRHIKMGASMMYYELKK